MFRVTSLLCIAVFRVPAERRLHRVEGVPGRAGAGAGLQQAHLPVRPRRRYRPALPKDAGWNVSASVISLCASDVTLYISNNRVQ